MSKYPEKIVEVPSHSRYYVYIYILDYITSSCSTGISLNSLNSYDFFSNRSWSYPMATVLGPASWLTWSAWNSCKVKIESPTQWKKTNLQRFLMFLLFSQKLGETHGQAHHLHTKTFTVLQSMVKSLEELHAAQSGWFAETLSTVGDFKFLALIIHP